MNDGARPLQGRSFGGGIGELKDGGRGAMRIAPKHNIAQRHIRLVHMTFLWGQLVMRFPKWWMCRPYERGWMLLKMIRRIFADYRGGIA